MLFTESQLQMSGNPIAVLNEATYLDENEAIIRPQTIPVSENTRIGAYTVRFDDVHRLAESHGVDYISAVVAIAESSGIDPAYLKVAVDEAEIIADPDVVLTLPENGVVVAPLSEQNLIYQYVLECINLWNQMPDTDEADQALAEALINDTYLEQFLTETSTANATSGSNGPSFLSKAGEAIKGGASKVGDFFTRDFKKAGQNWNNANKVSDKLLGRRNTQGQIDLDNSTNVKMLKAVGQNVGAAAGHAAKGVGKIGLTAGAIGGVILGAKKLLGAKDQPKSVIAQKIASLRKVYQSWMQKAAKGGPGVGDKLKQAAAKLLSIIDALMAKMQKAAG